MEFIVESYFDYKFDLSLITNIENMQYLQELDKKDNIVILNPDYIVSSYQIMLSINRALYNFKILKKHKSEKLKKEIIYYSSEKSKVDLCVKSHKINLDRPNAYLLFINLNKDEIKGIKSELKGKEITPDNYSKFVDLEKIIKEFEISKEEIENDVGIIGAVYNRIGIKDLK